MYPGELLNLFPPFPRTDMVFVAMSFDDAFLPRWVEVIQPAASSVEVNNKKLSAHRVDLVNKNDSLITEIVKNISECRLFLADISTIGYLPIDARKNKPIRNANVMYEIGIAHACRLPEEVIILRSDNDPLDFDIAGVRIHSYDPTNKKEASLVVQNLIINALDSIDDRKHMTVEKAVQSLDITAFLLLQESLVEIQHPRMRSMRDIAANTERVAAINRMLSAGLFETKFKELTSDAFTSDMPFNEVISYVSTPFGRNVLAKARQKSNFIDAVQGFLKTEKGKEFIEGIQSG